MSCNLKRKEFSPKKPEYAASYKRRGEVKSEPIVLSDEHEGNNLSVRRRIGFDSGSGTLVAVTDMTRLQLQTR